MTELQDTASINPIFTEAPHKRRKGATGDEYGSKGWAAFGQCGATTKGTGLPCKQPAGKNTTHIGEGFCWKHEAAPNRGIPRHYRKRAHTIEERARQYAEDPAIYDIAYELGLASALRDESVRLYASDPNSENAKALRAVLNDLFRARDRYLNMMQKKQMMITAPHMHQILVSLAGGFVTMLEKHVLDLALRTTIQSDLADYMRGALIPEEARRDPSPDGPIPTSPVSPLVAPTSPVSPLVAPQPLLPGRLA